MPLPLPCTYEISRYPADLIDTWHAPSGARFMLRPILPQDDEALGAFFERLSLSSRQRRFHAPVNGLAAAALVRMTRLDYRDHLAMVITTVEQGREVIVADARYALDEGGESAEFGLVVDDRWQRCGLGRRALRALIDAATGAGLAWLHGSVLHDNLPMLRLMADQCFACTPDREDEAVVHVELRLRRATPPAADWRRAALDWLLPRTAAMLR